MTYYIQCWSAAYQVKLVDIYDITQNKKIQYIVLPCHINSILMKCSYYED